MDLTFEEIFNRETQELTDFCETNNLVQYHSGGGNFHYALNDEKTPWLFNAKDYESLPTHPSDVCVGGLWLGDIVDIFIESNDVDDAGELMDKLEQHLIDSNIDGVVVNNSNVNIEDKSFIDILPIVDNVNVAIKNFLESL